MIARQRIRNGLLTLAFLGIFFQASISCAAPSQDTRYVTTISSATHPDSSQWYNSNTVDFQWTVPTGATSLRLLVDNSSTSSPTVVYKKIIDKKEITNLDDGIHYFHVAFDGKAGKGTPAHYAFHIDTVPPLPFEITSKEPQSQNGVEQEIFFRTTDVLSGIDYYEVTVGDNRPIYSNTETSLVVPVHTPGTVRVTVRAFDKAGNSTVASRTLLTKEPKISLREKIWSFIPTNTYSEPAFFFAGAFAMAILALYLHTQIQRKKQLERDVWNMELSIHEEFHALRHEIASHMKILEKAKKKRDLTKEEKVIMENVADTLKAVEKSVLKKFSVFVKHITRH